MSEHYTIIDIVTGEFCHQLLKLSVSEFLRRDVAVWIESDLQIRFFYYVTPSFDGRRIVCIKDCRGPMSW